MSNSYQHITPSKPNQTIKIGISDHLASVMASKDRFVGVLQVCKTLVENEAAVLEAGVVASQPFSEERRREREIRRKEILLQELRKVLLKCRTEDKAVVDSMKSEVSVRRAQLEKILTDISYFLDNVDNSELDPDVMSEVLMGIKDEVKTALKDPMKIFVR